MSLDEKKNLLLDAIALARSAGFSTAGSADRDCLETVFSEGLSHDTALFSNGSDKFVVKVFRTTGQLFEQAIAAQRFASALGLAPKVLFDDVDSGVQISTYIPLENTGELIKGNTLNGRHLNAIALSLSRLHAHSSEQSAEQLGHFDLLRFCQHYLRNAGAQDKHRHSVLEPFIERMQACSDPVLCHNDLIADNIFCAELEQAQFVDWEYAQHNDRFFDLAAVTFYLGLSDVEKTQFLQEYFSNSPAAVKTHFVEADTLNALGQQRLRDATVGLLWGDVLWHLDKFGKDYEPRLAQKVTWLTANVDGFV